MSESLLKVQELSVHFGKKPGRFLPGWPKLRKAVDGVSFELAHGQALGVVGESGCGKTTLARAILKLLPATAGRIVWAGRDLSACSSQELRLCRREMQIVFQNPLDSLDPRMTIGTIIAEPLNALHPEMPRAVVLHRVKEIMARVGLSPAMINRYPHEFSGGQCQRIGIARAVVLRPKLIICDEPVSALDVSIQAQIVNLLRDLQEELGLSLMFISHDLSVVKHLCTRVLVLYLGKVMELADADSLFEAPLHPYTQALMAAVPVPDPLVEKRRLSARLVGNSARAATPGGCVYRMRCPLARGKCAEIAPALEAVGADHEVACHYWRDGSGGNANT